MINGSRRDFSLFTGIVGWIVNGRINCICPISDSRTHFIQSSKHVPFCSLNDQRRIYSLSIVWPRARYSLAASCNEYTDPVSPWFLQKCLSNYFICCWKTETWHYRFLYQMFTFFTSIAVRFNYVSQNLLHARSNSGKYLCQKSIYSVFTYSNSVVERKSK